jgi:hypothetical protein
VILSAPLILRVGGVSRRIPDARRTAELEWLDRVSVRFPRLGSADGWAAEFGRELNATEDRASFGRAGLPVIEGKHLRAFAVDPDRTTCRVSPEAATRLMPDRRFARARLAYRDVSGAANRQALIAAIVPGNVVTTHTLFCLRSPLDAERQFFLCGLFNSSALNAVVRMLMGGHVTTALVESLPVPRWTAAPEQRRIAQLAAVLTQRPGDEARAAELNGLVAEIYRFRLL